MELKYTQLPLDFIDLLKSNMNTKGEGHRKLKNTYWHTGSINFLIKNCFKDIDQGARYDRVLHSLGWLGVRDRIAASYIGYHMKGRYEDTPDLTLLEEILDLEERLKPYTIDGHSRGFLLGFYIKMQLCDRYGAYSDEESESIIFDSEIIDLLDVAKSKLLQVDWLCITLMEIAKYKKISYIKDQLQGGCLFTDLLNDLPRKERDKVIRSLCHYGASIGDQDIFFEQMV